MLVETESFPIGISENNTPHIRLMRASSFLEEGKVIATTATFHQDRSPTKRTSMVCIINPFDSPRVFITPFSEKKLGDLPSKREVVEQAMKSNSIPGFKSLQKIPTFIQITPQLNK